MRYTCNGLTIFAEDAAKPASQSSSYVVELLNRIGPFRHGLDYGCGRLRYATHLYHLTRTLTVVDSTVQLDRTQLLFGTRTTVREHVHKFWRATRALDTDEFANDSRLYDFSLCSNVLSSVPDCSDRINMLCRIGLRLARNGKLLVTSQYTNSYFCDKMRDEGTMKYNDGFLLGKAERASFYGLIPLPKLESYTVAAGLSICQSWRHNQSAYVIAKRMVM
jgi:hypothetical protein